jgi:hypothetical protein
MTSRRIYVSPYHSPLNLLNRPYHERSQPPKLSTSSTSSTYYIYIYIYRCIEKIIGYLNKNAYIMCATHNMHFCQGAFKGFMLLLRNFLRVAAINMVTPAIMFFGKVFICLSTFAVVYAICTNQAAELGLTTQPFLTLLLCLIIGYGVGDTFMSVVEAAVDCIMLSFLHDSGLF